MRQKVFVGLCTACLLLMQATSAKAEVEFIPEASKSHQSKWEYPAKRTLTATTKGWGSQAQISVWGSKSQPTVKVFHGGRDDILYKVEQGQDEDEWIVKFWSKTIWNKNHILAAEIYAENDNGWVKFPVLIKFTPNIKVKVEVHKGGGFGDPNSSEANAWRGNLTLHTGYSVNANPGGKTGHGFFLTFGGPLYTWDGKIPISLVFEGNVVYSNYKLEYNTEGRTEWAHLNSTEFQPRLGIRIRTRGDKKGRFGVHITPFVGGVLRVVKHDNDVTGLSDDLRLHLIHGRLELNGGIAAGLRVALFFNSWLGVSAEFAWAGTWDTLKEIGEPIKWGFASFFYGNIGVTGRF